MGNGFSLDVETGYAHLIFPLPYSGLIGLLFTLIQFDVVSPAAYVYICGG